MSEYENIREISRVPTPDGTWLYADRDKLLEVDPVAGAVQESFWLIDTVEVEQS